MYINFLRRLLAFNFEIGMIKPEGMLAIFTSFHPWYFVSIEF